MTPSVRTLQGSKIKSFKGSSPLCPRGSNSHGFSNYDRNDIQIDARELERLQILSGHIDEPGEFIPDSVYVDPEYLEVDSLVTSD